MNFFFRKLFHNYIKPEQEALLLVEIVTGSAHKTFADEQFRKHVKFYEQPEGEQSRIYNELVISALVLLIFSLEDNVPRIELERSLFWQQVGKKVPKVFLDWLKSIHITDEYIVLWKEFMEIRLEEYRKDQIEVRRAWLKEIIEGENEELSDSVVRVQTIIIETTIHVSHGNAKPEDELSKYLTTWFSALNSRLEKRIGW